MNLQHYINTTRDKTGLGHSWDKSWWPWGPEVRSWAMVILEDPGGQPMREAQWQQVSGVKQLVLRKLFWSSTDSRSVTEDSVGSSPTDWALMSRWSTQFLLPEQSTFDDLLYSEQSLVQVLWECFAIQVKKIKKFFSDADSNTNEGALSTLSLTYFWVQFCLDYFYLCTWDAKWTTPDFSAANRGGRSWFSIFKNQRFPFSYAQNGNLKSLHENM